MFFEEKTLTLVVKTCMGDMVSVFVDRNRLRLKSEKFGTEI